MLTVDKITEKFDFYKVESLFHLSLEDRVVIANLMKKCYKDGFVNGTTLRETEILETELTQNKKS